MTSTHFENIEHEIVKTLKCSTKSICGMIAWLTNPNILNGLNDALKNGSSIKIILSNSEWNLIAKTKINELIALGAEFKTMGAHDTNDTNSFMHHKLCVIDENIVLNGSFNWTKKASTNYEGYSIKLDEKDALNCLTYFEKYWLESTNLDWTKIENHARFSIETLERFEVLGKSPEELTHLNSDEPDEIETINKLKNEETMELAKIKNNEIVLEITDFRTNENYDFNYEKDLEVFGVDFIEDFGNNGIWYKLRLKIDEIVHNVAIEKVDLLEILKNDDHYSKYWFNNYQIPLSLLNSYKGRIKFLKPVKFIKLIKEDWYTISDSLIDNANSRCNYKLCIDLGNIMYLKTKRLSTLNILDYVPVENDHYIK